MSQDYTIGRNSDGKQWVDIISNEVNYIKTDDGKWFKIVKPLQCNERLLFAGKCQGIKDHKGVHWSYANSGSYAYSDNKNDPTTPKNIGGGMIPPDHKDYIHPKDKMKDAPSSHWEKSEVTDADEIARLERGEIKDGESIDIPFDALKDPETAKILEERMKRYRKTPLVPFSRIYDFSTIAASIGAGAIGGTIGSYFTNGNLISVLVGTLVAFLGYLFFLLYLGKRDAS